MWLVVYPTFHVGAGDADKVLVITELKPTE